MQFLYIEVLVFCMWIHLCSAPLNVNIVDNLFFSQFCFSTLNYTYFKLEQMQIKFHLISISEYDWISLFWISLIRKAEKEKKEGEKEALTEKKTNEFHVAKSLQHTYFR